MFARLSQFYNSGCLQKKMRTIVKRVLPELAQEISDLAKLLQAQAKEENSIITPTCCNNI
jgi:hypothetical protein